MPHVVSVSDIRRQLYWAAGGPQAAGAGEPTIALLGGLFHRLFAQLTGPDRQVNLVGPLQLADGTLASWRIALTTHAYKSFVAAALSDHQAVLQARAREVVAFWAAVKALCDWLAAVVFEQHGSNETIESIRSRVFSAAEQPLSAELTDPAWTDSVIVQGRADSIVAQRGTNDHCVIELKLGRTAPEADLLQGCLYHLLLGGTNAQTAASRLTLMTFDPARRESSFDARQLEDAKAKLKALVWRLAGGTAEPTPQSVRQPKRESETATTVSSIGQTLQRAFAEFGSPIELEGAPTIGPTFIRFLATPQRGVSARGLTRIGESVWMRLGTTAPPHVHLERGRVAIDVERPEDDRGSVLFSEWRHALPGRDRPGCPRFAVGVSVDGHLHHADLSKPESAHVLIAGTSGSGKSEWLRAAVASLLVSNHVETLRLALIDPKRTAFGALSGSPYLWGPIIDSEGVESLLDSLVDEMERRYQAISQAGFDHVAAYNATLESPVPRIVCVCDEYADLLLVDRKRRELVENRIARLGAKARAAGIHLIFATQRPSRDIVKGVIDANFSARVALKVVKSLESRIVIGESGAETLLGRGDLLYKDIGSPVRLQGLLTTREDVEDLARQQPSTTARPGRSDADPLG